MTEELVMTNDPVVPTKPNRGFYKYLTKDGVYDGPPRIYTSVFLDDDRTKSLGTLKRIKEGHLHVKKVSELTSLGGLEEIEHGSLILTSSKVREARFLRAVRSSISLNGIIYKFESLESVYTIYYVDAIPYLPSLKRDCLVAPRQHSVAREMRSYFELAKIVEETPQLELLNLRLEKPELATLIDIRLGIL